MPNVRDSLQSTTLLTDVTTDPLEKWTSLPWIPRVCIWVAVSSYHGLLLPRVPALSPEDLEHETYWGWGNIGESFGAEITIAYPPSMKFHSRPSL